MKEESDRKKEEIRKKEKEGGIECGTVQNIHDDDGNGVDNAPELADPGAENEAQDEQAQGREHHASDDCQEEGVREEYPRLVNKDGRIVLLRLRRSHGELILKKRPRGSRQ